MIKVSIVGATAYTSCELISILTRHPHARIVHLGGRREANPQISSIFPSLRGRCDMRLSGLELGEAPEKPDVAFFTLPHGVSHQYVPSYLDASVKCIDFSSDYRFADVQVYERHYGVHGDPGNISRAVYGIPELFRPGLRDADLVANPGCYPTSALLALAPFVRGGMIDAAGIIIDSKSGISGRGNKPDPGSLFCECNENINAYAVGTHRHAPEIEQGVEMLGGKGADVLFVPHLVPMDRGILSTIYVRLVKDASSEELRAAMADFYSGEPFIRVLGAGEQPGTKSVANTNCCDVAAEYVGNGRAVITSAIDNLARGASSQAVQNMNAVFGLDEQEGLI